MARLTTLKPATPGAGLLLAFLVDTFGSLGAGARAANLPELTVRRYIFDPPKRPQLHVIEALENLVKQHLPKSRWAEIRSWLPGQAA